MKVLLALFVLQALLYTPYGENVQQNLKNIDFSEYEDSLLNNETELLDKELSEDINDTEGKVVTFESVVTAADGEDESEDETEEGLSYGGINTCGAPPVVEHAQISSNKRPPHDIGTSLSYVCEFGYSADGANHISICSESNTPNEPSWTNPELFCIPRSCGDPGFVTNARRIGSRFTFPNSVTFECDGGYELRGSSIRYCQVNGRWSGSLPSCEKIFCDTPDHPEHGRVSFTSLEYGSQLRYECDKGFILKNHHTRSCSENGTWSGTEPLCLDAQCEQPVAPEYGFVETVGGIPRVGSIAIYTCRKDRKLIGSGTSKCLEIGEWTFPTPKCVEPCNIIDVSHGEIGRYEKRRRNSKKVFSVLDPGTRIDDRIELFLRCENGYEPMGKEAVEEKVLCEHGLWSELPMCKEASCRSDPPSMKNGRVSSVNIENGQGVVYLCGKYFKKTKYGNVTCHFGSWRGVTPICTDTRCYVDNIRFPGLVNGKKNIYLNRESYQPTCDKGYNLAKPENKLVCEEGMWRGHFPPCTAASCSKEPPPSPEHGRIKFYSELHSSIVSYECDESYLLQSQGQVQCLFGVWEGSPPVCKDSRCDFRDLTLAKGVISPISLVNSGETLEVQCNLGYSPISVRPLCTKGEWTEYGSSPCKESNCIITKVNNGAITKQTFDRRLTWTGYVTDVIYNEVRIGNTKPPQTVLHTSCSGGYSFQGRNQDHVEITCKEGRWHPTPICLRPGTLYEEKLPSTSTTSLPKLIPDLPQSTKVAATKQTVSLTSESVNLLTEPDQQQIGNRKANEDSCACIYQGTDDLVAYAGNELLTGGSRVKNDDVVKFYCRNFGYARLNGPTHIICKDCRTWHSSEYPDCLVPVRGDAIIRMDPLYTVLPEGIISVVQGVETQTECFGNGVADYPVWTAPPSNTFQFQADENIGGQVRRSSYLVIPKSGPEHNGIYTCAVNGFRPTTIQIEVLMQCTKFAEKDDVIIFYDKRQSINSSAIFTCKDRNNKLEGMGILTCLSNGRWSGDPPKCTSFLCPKLNETDSMLITYSKELNVGTTATFHCFVPYMRKGNSNVRCLNNGQWSGLAPTCTLPRCHLETLFQHIPENVVPNMENVNNDTLPHGYELPLTCEGNLRITEPTKAKCGNNGVWEVSKVQCVPGCEPIKQPEVSQLIIEPEKAFYRFGELVALSCAPGQVLNAEVEILMCLRDGWSETDIPYCIDT